MRLKKISVENLFGIYKYELNLIEQSQSPVTIIHAPNGMGKTTLLKMIQAVIEGDIIYIDSIPFAKFRLDFEEGSYIEVCKVNIDESILNNSFAQLRSKLLHLSNQNMNEDSVIFDNILYVVNGKTFKTELRKDFISLLVRRTRLNHSESSEDITFADLIGDGENVYYNNDDVFVMDDLSVALSDLSKNFNVYFIKTNRLFRKVDPSIRDERFRRRNDQRREIVQSVELFKDKIKDKILSVGKEFADKSEKLDRTFPQRVLNAIFSEHAGLDTYDKDKIKSLLADLEKRRAELSELGLITEVEGALVDIPEKENLTEETKIFLTNYIEDNITKLEIYKALSDELRLLREIINNRNEFSDKKMRYSASEGIEFISKNGRTIPIDKLSSGEKNNLILFYELIFECGNHSLMLIDEPEISLHVAWQRQFVDEFNEIARIKGLQGIVATHSPDIVGDNYDCMIDLEDLSDV